MLDATYAAILFLRVAMNTIFKELSMSNGQYLTKYNFAVLLNSANFEKLTPTTMNKPIFSLLLLAFPMLLNAQTVDQIKADRQTYIWGEGKSVTLEGADTDALAMLINQISTQVESKYSLLKSEVQGSGKGSFDETFKAVINTYSSATLRNTERIVLGNEPDAHIFRYVKRAEVDKIFADRAKKIVEFARNGLQSSESGRVADALRYYYWSLTLLRSHPDASTIGMNDGKGNERLLISWLPMLINEVFSDVSIAIASNSKTEGLTTYTLNVNYKNQPARNFDFCYWTGRDWTNIYSVKDGIGVIEFMDPTGVDEIRVKAEYVFKGETSIDNELRDVMGKLDVVPFRNSYINIKTESNTASAKFIVKDKNFSAAANRGIVSLVADPKPYETKMRTLVDAIKSGTYESARSLFTSEGYQVYTKILQYGQARIIGEPELRFVNFENGVMCRSIPMQFNFKNNTRSFVEDVVFHFGSDKKISNITFGLGEMALNDIVGKDVWTERVRLILINFLENYKTAYALKRADYIESIFADDALIIVGSVLKTNPGGDNRFLNNDIIKYNRYDKAQYIRNLRHSFASNEFINIRFEDNIIRKSGKGGEVYGIQIKQDYFSTNYGDTGYLFLMVDINDPDKPIIHVRTWQPKKNEDGSIYGLGDF